MAGSVSNWLEAVQTGNEDAAQQLWNRYYESLVRVARSRLPSQYGAMSDEDDIATHAFEIFFRGIRAGRFPNVCDRNNLWRLLLFIATRKVAQSVRHERRKKRSSSLKVRIAECDDYGSTEFIGREPGPELVIEAIDSLRELISSLCDDKLEKVVIYKMEGCSNLEIAHRLGCSASTVERKLKRIRHEWSRRADLWTGC